ncbi:MULTISPECIES: chromate transporter [Paenibacillus]|uniref:Chromate transporter n=3 Tax=Paenibacillus TaxID=44249 RepID=A0ABU3RF39_9BACL|nr:MULTISPECIES: chromate transporter [Paenibacillus]MBA2940186.1 chromate transporter [Paenibacillus sp. CGMCC 1.16610]MCY9661402.1 chromate transporter [Paenibacillus anseongense]MDU0202674.1 chromate transporter [Paenibacillus sp. PFR10]MEB4798521.1 chromate transporter [Paenibacillus chondroitinus]MEC0267645.1 chromate transporter [Paenibacillus anseongense]
MVYWNLFLGFFRIGLLGYGGGPTMIPLVHAEAVQKYQWMTDDEFTDVLAMGNALPGPIATKMAGYIGYKVKGYLGAFIAIAAMVIPVLVGMILLLGLIYKLKDSGIVGGMTHGIQPVIGVMMAVMAYDFFKKAWQSWVKSKTLAWTLISIIALVLLNLNPGLLIGIALAYAFTESTYLANKKKRNQQQRDADRGFSA